MNTRPTAKLRETPHITAPVSSLRRWPMWSWPQSVLENELRRRRNAQREQVHRGVQGRHTLPNRRPSNWLRPWHVLLPFPRLRLRLRRALRLLRLPVPALALEVREVCLCLCLCLWLYLCLLLVHACVCVCVCVGLSAAGGG